MMKKIIKNSVQCLKCADIIESKDRHDYLVEAANFSAHAFFNEQAVRQNIVSVQYFCRNGIVQNLRQV